MKHILAAILFIAATSTASVAQMSHEMPTGPAPTYTKDVAPILYKNCAGCHRPGEAGPFSMLTYEDTKPWVGLIKHAITQKVMPPWFADPRYGHFSNERRLSTEEIRTLVQWANSGAQKGDPKDMPPVPANFVEGWGISKPDAIFELPRPFSIPEQGMMEYQYVIVPTGFKKDTWVQQIEVRPTDRSIVHHIIAYLREPGSNYFKDMKTGVFFEAPPPKQDEKTDTSALPSDFLVGYAPGQPAEILQPGQGKLIKAGTDIVFEVHYTPNGKATTDRTRLGLVFAKETPKERVLTMSVVNGKFKIPPGDPNYRVDGSWEALRDVKLVGVHPHMHGRGKDFDYTLIFPDGKTEKILSVPVYNWHWQLWYNLAEPISLPKGTKIACVAHFDNSANNPENPDPTKTVIWGQQSWDEMMVGFFNVIFDAKMPSSELYPPGEAPTTASNTQK